MNARLFGELRRFLWLQPQLRREALEELPVPAGLAVDSDGQQFGIGVHRYSHLFAEVGLAPAFPKDEQLAAGSHADIHFP